MASPFTAEQHWMLGAVKEFVERGDAATLLQVLAIVVPLLPRELAADGEVGCSPSIGSGSFRFDTAVRVRSPSAAPDQGVALESFRLDAGELGGCWRRHGHAC